jgi:hypothetical protein
MARHDSTGSSNSERELIMVYPCLFAVELYFRSDGSVCIACPGRLSLRQCLHGSGRRPSARGVKALPCGVHLSETKSFSRLLSAELATLETGLPEIDQRLPAKPPPKTRAFPQEQIRKFLIHASQEFGDVPISDSEQGKLEILNGPTSSVTSRQRPSRFFGRQYQRDRL